MESVEKVIWPTPGSHIRSNCRLLGSFLVAQQTGIKITGSMEIGCGSKSLYVVSTAAVCRKHIAGTEFPDSCQTLDGSAAPALISRTTYDAMPRDAAAMMVAGNPVTWGHTLTGRTLRLPPLSVSSHSMHALLGQLALPPLPEPIPDTYQAIL